MSYCMVMRLLEAMHKGEWTEQELRAYRLIDMLPDLIFVAQNAHTTLRRCLDRRRHRPEEIQHSIDGLKRVFQVIEADPLAFLRDPIDRVPVREEDKTRERVMTPDFPRFRRA